MHFEDLEIKNFMAIGEVSCSLREKGLVLIQGENRDDTSQDSNGSGKSSIVDALSWALAGITARGDRADEVINRYGKGGASVAITLDDDGQKYRITRTRQRGKLGLLLQAQQPDTSWLDISKGTSQETQKLIEKILGCSEDVFNAAIYAAQEKMPDLPGMTDQQLKLLIEEAAGIQRIQEAYTEARSRLTLSQNREDDRQNQLSASKKAHERAEQQHAFAREQFANWKKTHAEKMANAKKRLLETKDAAESAAAEIEALEKQIASNNSAIKAYREGMAEQLAKQNAEITEAQQSWQKSGQLLAKADTAKKQETERLKRTLKSLYEVEALPGKPCHECHKPYTKDDVADQTERLRKAVEEQQVTYKSALAAYEEASKKYSEDAERLNGLRKASGGAFEKEYLAIDNLNTKNAELSKKLGQLSQVKKQLAQCAKECQELTKEENPHTATVERSAREAAERFEEQESIQYEIGVLAAETKLLKEAAGVFGTAGVRAHILDSVTPFLNARTLEYLTVLTDGNIGAVWSTLTTSKKGEVKEKFCIDVQSKTGAGTFRSLSGGEKRKVRLACSMALQDLVSSRAVKPIHLYIADEIDHALDESGMERLMIILDAKAKERGTVLTISHNALGGIIRNVVTIVKEDGVARLEGDALNV